MILSCRLYIPAWLLPILFISPSFHISLFVLLVLQWAYSRRTCRVRDAMIDIMWRSPLAVALQYRLGLMSYNPFFKKTVA